MNDAVDGIVAASAALDIRMRDFGALAQVVAWPGMIGQVGEAMQALGVSLPAEPGCVDAGAGAVAMTVAPGRWLVEIAEGALPGLPAEVGIVTDLNHARRSLVVTGPMALAFAAKIVPVDFDLPRHAPGCVVQTGSGHTIPFTLWRRASEVFVLYVESSYGRDFAHGLAAEAEEFLGR